MPTIPSVDQIASRSSTEVIIIINGQKVGRVQSFDKSINNNVQVLAELGSAYNVELKKGVTSYTFTIAKFLVRNDVFDDIKHGAIFGLGVRDMATVPEDSGGGQAETLESFPLCSVQSMTENFTIGAATVGVNATVVTIGKGIQQPTLVA